MLTNFSALDADKKIVWSRDTWMQAREKSFCSKFMGTSDNSMIHRITELTKSERGDNAVVTLVPDMEGDGVVGDNTLTGNETALKAHQDKVGIDQLRNAIGNTGKLNDQKSVVNFREKVKDNLSYWLADRMDQMCFLSLAGLDFAQTNDGRVRPNSSNGDNLSDLAFNYALAPTSERHLMVQAGGSVVDADLTAITAADKIGYNHIVNLQAIAKTRYLRGIRGNGGSEVYHLFLHPLAMAALKLDPDFKENARHAGARDGSNTLWAGGESYIVDGLHIHEYRHVPTSLGAAPGSKAGATGQVDVCHAVLCGAQALGFIDLDSADWDERDHFDYGNRYGIAYGKIFGMKKMQFKDNKGSSDRNVKQDYGVIRLDMAIPSLPQ